MVYIPTRNNASNLVGLLVYSNVFDVLNINEHAVQFGSTRNTMDARLFVNANEEHSYGLQVYESNAQRYFNIGAWDTATQTYKKQFIIDPNLGPVFPNEVRFDGDVYVYGNLGIGTTQPLPKVHLDAYSMDLNGSFYATGTVFTSNLVVYGCNTILNTVTCNTDQMIITNVGTGPALIVTQQGQGLEYAIAEFRDLDESNVAMIIADGGFVGIGTRFPYQPLDVAGQVYARSNVGVGTATPRAPLDVIGTALISSAVGVGTETPRATLDISGGSVIVPDGNLGIGTTMPRAPLDVFTGGSLFAPNVGIGTSLPRTTLDLQGTLHAAIGVGIGTTVTRASLDVVAGGVFGTSVGIGTTTPRVALDVANGSILVPIGNLGIGTTTPRAPLDVSGLATLTGPVGVGTLTPRPGAALDVVGAAVFSTAIGIGTTTPRAGLDVETAQVFVAGNLGIGTLTTRPGAGLDIWNRAVLLSGSAGNLGIGTTTPTAPLHIDTGAASLTGAPALRLNHSRFNYRIPLASTQRIIQWFQYSYTTTPSFFIRVVGTLYGAYSSSVIDIAFGGRYGYGVQTNHARQTSRLVNLSGADITPAVQVRFYKTIGATDAYTGFLVFNDGTSETVGADVSFEVYFGEDTFVWNPTATLPDAGSATLYWNALVRPNETYADTSGFLSSPLGIGTGVAGESLPGLLTLHSTSNTQSLLHATQSSTTPTMDFATFQTASGTPVFQIAASGNLGVGTAIPQTTLDVRGTLYAATALGIGTTTPRAALDVPGSALVGTALGIGTTTPRPGAALDVAIGSVIVPIGNLGIGTDAPRAALDVAGAAVFGTAIGIGTLASRAAFDLVGSAIISSRLGIGTVAPRAALDVAVGSAVVPAGNLGIGTDAPRATLEVSGTTALLGTVGIGTTLVSPSAQVSLTGTLMFHSFNGDKVYFTQDPSGAKVAYTDGTVSVYSDAFQLLTAAGVPRVIVSPTGAVGIGTTTPRPGTALDVVGTTAISSNLSVGGTAWVAGALGVGTTTSRPGAALDIVGGDALFAGNLGIGTTTPMAALDVFGEVKLRQNTDIQGTLLVGTALGIGTTTPRAALDVPGSALVGTALGIGTVAPRLGAALDVAIGQVLFVGNLGIGTDAPRAALDVAGAALVSTALGIGTLAPRAALEVALGSVLLSTGNLGVGTTTPPLLPAAFYASTALLLPKGTTDARADIDASHLQSGLVRYNTTTSRFEGFGASNQWGALGGTVSVNGDTYIATEYTPGSGDGNLRFVNCNVETMRIQPDGNVGIGTTAPFARLTLTTPANYSGDTFRIVARGEPNNYYLNLTERSPEIGRMTHVLSTMNNGTLIDNLITIDHTNIGIGTARARHRLDIDSGSLVVASGNLGIGTTTPPSARLDVVGNARVGDGDSRLFVQPGVLYAGGSATPSANTTWLGMQTVGGTLSLSDTVLLHGGNLGIGTVAPASTLAIGVGGATLGAAYTGIVAPTGSLLVAGAVGIGTTTPRPGVALDIVGGTALVAGTLGIGTTTPRPGAALDVVGGTALVAGSLGIGTTTPLAPLHLQGTGYMSGNLGLGTTTPRATLHLTTATGAPAIQLDGGATGNFINIQDPSFLRFGSDQSYKTHVLVVGDAFAGGAGGRINLRYKNYIALDAVNGVSGTGVEKIRIDAVGNVGIGTSAPRAALDVVAGGLFGTSVGIGTLTPRAALDIAAGSAIVPVGNLGIGTATPRVALDIAGGDALVASGNLGIGTASPRAALDVAGGNVLVAAGHLGIGTLTPRTALDIANGSVLIPAGNLGIGTTQIYAGAAHFYGNLNLHEGSVQFLSSQPGTLIEKYYASGDRYGLGQYTPNILRAYVSDTNASASFRVARAKTDGSFTDQLTLAASGNLGIGTTTPKEALELTTGSLLLPDDQGVLYSKDPLVGMALPTGLLRRRFSHSKNTYPASSAEFRSYFATGMTYLDTVVVAQINQPSGNAGDQYAYEFIGFLYASVAGRYDFRVNSDDASEVYIDSKLVANYYGQHTMAGAGVDGTAYLTTGLHAFAVRFQEVGGTDGIVVSWRPPGEASYAVVPTSAFYYRPGDAVFAGANTGDLTLLTAGIGNLGIGTTTPRAAVDFFVETQLIAGNLGIGTATPRAALDVAGGAAVISGGNLGVGTHLPLASLDVRGTALLTDPSGLYDEQKATTATTDGAGLTLLGDSNIATLRLIHGSTAAPGTPGIEFIHEHPTVSAWKLHTVLTPTTAALVLTENTSNQNASRMTFLPNGNVGVGTVAPTVGFQVSNGSLVVSAGNLGVGTTAAPPVRLAVFGTDALLLPAGTNAERPSAPVAGYVRYNNENQQFEGYGPGNTWGSLGGVKSTDQLTYITAESAPGANDSNLRFYTGGVLRALINPLGNLGVGTATPATRLHVEGGHLALIGGNLGIGTIAPHTFLDIHGTAFIQQALGIGTTAPRAALDVEAGTILLRGNLGIGTTTPRAAFELNAADAILLGNIGIGTVAPRAPLEIQAATVLLTGNLGIGTTAPRATLDITQPVRLTQTIVLAEDTPGTTAVVGHPPAPIVQTERVDVGWTPNTFASFYSKHHGTTPGQIRLVSTGGVQFRTTDETTETVRVALDANGNLGIGTAAPSVALDVVGTVRSTDLTADRAVVSDSARRLVSSATTATQIGYLATLTSSVQEQLDGKLSLLGGTLTSNLTVGNTLFTSNLVVLGSNTVLNTTTSNTDQFTITNDGTGPALVVIQTGEQPVAAFYDHETGLSMLIDNNGHVGIGTIAPREHLQVSGGSLIVPDGNIGIGTIVAQARLDADGDTWLHGNLGLGGVAPAGAYRLYASPAGAPGAPTVILNATGAVGMGTTAAATGTQLHVWGKTTVYDGTTGAPATGESGGTGTRLVLNPGSVSAVPVAMGVSAGSTLWTAVPSGGTQAWYAGTQESMRLAASGNLGLGTTTPGLRLDVAGALGAERMYVGSAADRTVSTYSIHLPTNGSIGSLGAGYASLQLSGSGEHLELYGRRLRVFADTQATIATERMTLDASGNLGIGTTAPRATMHLDVAGSTGTAGTALVAYGNLGIGTVVAAAALHIQNGDILLGNNAAGGHKLYLTSVPTTHYIQASATDQWMELQTATNAGFRFQSTTTPWVSIQGADGNVGVGTTTPRAPLHVVGTTVVSGNLGVGTAAPRAPLDLQTAIAGVSALVAGGVGIGTTAPALPGAAPGLDLFGTGGLLVRGGGSVGVGTTTPRAEVDFHVPTMHLAGNLGIGTTTPRGGAALDVPGLTLLGTVGIGTTALRAGAALDIQATTVLLSGTLGIGTTIPSGAGGVGALKLDVHGTAYINGNLGIGTELPRAMLDVLDSVLIAERLGVGTTAPRAAIDIAAPGGSLLVAGNLGVGTTAPRGALDITGGACFINQGNLGIGTATPAALPLEVWSTKALLIPVGSNAERPAVAYKGYLRYNTTTDQFEGYGAGNQWGSLGGVRDVAGETYISAELSAGAADNNLRFITSNQERMRIDRNGNVGIGTDLPLAFLNLYDRDAAKATLLVHWDSPTGKRYASLDAPTNSFVNPVLLDTNNSWAIQTNGATRLTIADSGATIATDAQLLLPDGSAAAPSGAFTNATTTGIFATGTSLGLTAGGAESMRLLANGNVGVGTTAPASRLHVFGDITATNFIGTATQVSQTLTRGSYLTGNNYNGSSATTWAVDATTTATANKVVARDASGTIYTTNAHVSGTMQIGDSSLDANTYLKINKSSLDVSTETNFKAIGINIQTSSSAPTQYANIGGMNFTMTNNAVSGAPSGYTYMTTSAFTIQNNAHLQNADVQKDTIDASAGTIENASIMYNTINALGTSTISTAVSTYNRLLTIQNATVSYYYGVKNEISIFDSSTLNNVYGTYTNVYKSSANPIQSMYGHYLNYATESVLPSYGLYFQNEKYNAFSGNVGIGTTIPRSSLHVAGNSILTGNVGIGTTVAKYPVDVVGNINFTGGLYSNGTPYLNTQWTTTGNNIYYTTGNVGVGTTSPNYPLHVIGSIYTTQSVISYSDRRAKFDLEVIPDPLEKIKELHGYTYSFIPPKLEPAPPDEDKSDTIQTLRRDTGLIAQEVERILPEAVHEDLNGMKAISYGNLAGLFVEALRAITERLERLESKLG